MSDYFTGKYMRENVRVIIFLCMRRTQSNKHLHSLISDINISLFLCFFVWKNTLFRKNIDFFVVNKKKKKMCACFTFFSYLHTKKNMSLQYNYVKMAKENKSSSIKYNCIFSVRTLLTIPSHNHPTPTQPILKKKGMDSRNTINTCVLLSFIYVWLMV
jgi:hypothetical protein